MAGSVGRPRKELDLDVALDLIARGESIPTVANELECSPITLRKRIAELQQSQGVLLQYRSLQSLQLTSLQARILEQITPQKIEEAPLRDLVTAFKILKDKEQDIVEGRQNEVRGLVAHLIELEKQEREAKENKLLGNGDSLVEDAEFESGNEPTAPKPPEQEVKIVQLADLDLQQW